MRYSAKGGSLIVAVVFLSCLSTSARSQDLNPNDFAEGVEITANGDGPIQHVVIPPAVYQTVFREDLGDLRVFNSEGQAVAHSIYRRERNGARIDSTVTLPLFPIRAAQGQGIDDASVRVTTNRTGTVVSVRPTRSAPVLSTIAGYIIDASSLDLPINGLRFEWVDDDQGFLANMNVQNSDDLATWSSWKSGAALANLSVDDFQLSQNEVSLPSRKARYIRVSWGAGGTPPEIAGALATLAIGRVEPERIWTTLAGPGGNPEERRFDYRLDGKMPVDRVRVLPPSSNMVMRVRVESAADEDGYYRQQYSGLAYRITRDGQEVSSPAAPVRRTTDSYWRVYVEQGAETLGSSRPRVEVGRVPERLFFVARGSGPFVMAYGSSSVEPSEFSYGELLTLAGGNEDDLFASATATVGDKRALGGSDRLVVSREIPWQQVVLWSSLVAGVLLLLILFAKMIRQMDRDRAATDAG